MNKENPNDVSELLKEAVLTIETSKVAEAIEDYWGKPCPEIHGNCPTCQAWAEYSQLLSKSTYNK